MKYCAVLALSIALFPILALPQTVIPKISWYRIYDGPGHGVDLTNAVCMDRESNLYLAGRSSGADGSQDLLLLRYSADGDSLVELRYAPVPHAWDEATAIAVDVDGNMYIVGLSTFEQNSAFAVFQKYSASGVLLWVKDFHGDTTIFSEATQVILNNRGEPIIGYDQLDARIARYSPSGDSMWAVSFHDDTSEYGVRYLATDKNNNVYAALGQSYWDGGDLPVTRIVLAKISDEGELLWRKQFEGERARKIVFDIEDNPILLSEDARIIKCNAEGETLWTRSYEPVSDSIVVTTDITVDANNDIVFTGYGLASGSWDYCISKLSQAGAVLWLRTFDSDEHLNDFALGMALDSENNIYVTGATHNSISVGMCYTVKYSSAGELRWNIKFDGPHSIFENGDRLFVDDSGNVYVGGDVADSTAGWNFLAFKLEQELQVGADMVDDNVPARCSLDQNFPNPFNPSTMIRFGIAGRSLVRIDIVDILGRHVATVVNGELGAGSYETRWQADVAGGVYVCRLEATDLHHPGGRFVGMKKLLLLR